MSCNITNLHVVCRFWKAPNHHRKDFNHLVSSFCFFSDWEKTSHPRRCWLRPRQARRRSPKHAGQHPQPHPLVQKTRKTVPSRTALPWMLGKEPGGSALGKKISSCRSYATWMSSDYLRIRSLIWWVTCLGGPKNGMPGARWIFAEVLVLIVNTFLEVVVMVYIVIYSDANCQCKNASPQRVMFLDNQTVQFSGFGGPVPILGICLRMFHV